MYYSAEIAADHITDHLPFRSTRKQWTGEWRRARFSEWKAAEKAIFSGNCLHRSVWEQDAGCSNHLTPTMQERPPFGAVFCDIKQCALALGFFLERCRRQRKREKKGAAVEILRRSTAEFREPQGAAMPKMPGVRITSLRPNRKTAFRGGLLRY